MQRQSFSLFEVYGIELEYMIVDRESYDVRPLAGWLLSQVGTSGAREVERGATCWSNELAMHVIELKGNGPVSDMSTLRSPLQENLRAMNDILFERGACLMGSAVHPWMNPNSQGVLWPFEDAPIYQALDRIFHCRGHAWFNLQSAHLNLPFADDREFAQLHAAIRLVLPIVPAIAAASPFLDGADTGMADARLHAYSQHCNRLPEAIGQVIPEPVSDRQQYHDVILAPLYEKLKASDHEGILQHEWSNARGAIARFDRGAIEIRLIDVQEHPGMDAGVLGAVAAAVRLLTSQAEDDLEEMNAIPTEALRHVLNNAIQHGENACVDNSDYLQLLTGQKKPCVGSRLWRQILARTPDFLGDERRTAEWIIDNGTLATRLRRAAGAGTPSFLRSMAQKLCRSLADGTPFEGPLG